MDPRLKKLLLQVVGDLGNQTVVAEEMGVNPATVSRWMADRQGMEVASCLRLAQLTGENVSDIMRWAGHDPAFYLPSQPLQLSDEARTIADRARVLEWERRRNELPSRVRAIADRTIRQVLDGYREVSESTPS